MPDQLDERARRRAWMVMMRHAYAQTPGNELLAIRAEYHDEWALLQGDYWAVGYDDQSRAIEAQIRYCEWHIREIEHTMERRLRAGITKTDTHSTEQWQDRFDAMRRQSLVEGLQMLGINLIGRRGKEWKAQCPFHEDDTPSFSVNEQKNLWTCYSCQRGGDLVEFVTLLYGKSRGEALAYLEKMLGSVAAGSLDRPAGELIEPEDAPSMWVA